MTMLPSIGDYIYAQIQAYSKLHVYEWKYRVTSIRDDGTIVGQKNGSPYHSADIGPTAREFKTWRPASKNGSNFIQYELGNMTYKEKIQEIKSFVSFVDD